MTPRTPVLLAVATLLAVTAAPAASASAATPTPTATTAAAPTPSCSAGFSAFDPSGRETDHRIQVASPPTGTTTQDTFYTGRTTRDTVAVGPLMSSTSGQMTTTSLSRFATATRSGRIYRHDRTVIGGPGTSVPIDSGWSSEFVVRGLPPVRALAEGGAATLYTLDAGTLRRFTGTRRAATTRSAGRATGFSTYRGLTLLRSEEKRDLLVATTTRGALMLIEVPRTPAFTPRFSPLRTTTWQVFDRLTTQRCGATTTLVGIDTRTGRAQAYTIGTLRTPTTSTSIRRWGPLPHLVRGALIAPHRYDYPHDDPDSRDW